MRPLFLVFAAILAGACGTRSSENSASCGLTAMAGATMALEEFRGGTKVLVDVPPGLDGTVPARVVGYGTTAATVVAGDEGPMVIYGGEGFPQLPGFGLALVEDSTDTFKGVLIYLSEPPRGYPALGGVSSGTYAIPLYGLRVNWQAVSTPRCPLFADIDSLRT
ncbi:MAG: hypothetical protein OEO17_15535 [Gemmatimonadota bacterium]|nr:hypothetical protein [Gemmatimonadota bacterium]